MLFEYGNRYQNRQIVTVWDKKSGKSSFKFLLKTARRLSDGMGTVFAPPTDNVHHHFHPFIAA